MTRGRRRPWSSASLVALVVAVVTTAVSLRLLGIRRGWGTALFSGVVGWGVAALLALEPRRLGLGRRRPRRSTCSRSASRRRWRPRSRSTCSPGPGSLAIGERAGPRRRAAAAARGPRRGSRCSAATASSCGSPAREGFGPFVSAGPARATGRTPSGVRLRRVLEEAGGVYVKLGQIAATARRPPAARVCAELARLQNRVAAEPVDAIRPVLEAELGDTVERGLRRVRLGAARGRVDRSDLPRPAAHRARPSS